MRINFKDLLFQINNGDNYVSARYCRLGIFAAIFIYSLFGMLDVSMLPVSYHYAWLIRYAIMAPFFIIAFALTYAHNFKVFHKYLLSFLVISGQLGIVAMMFFASPAEDGYWSYYAGLILVILWAVIIFRLSIPEILLTASTNVFFYNILAFFVQKLHTYPVGSKEFGYLLNNNFFLISASSLAILGAMFLNYYKNKIKAQNRTLKKEKKALYIAKKKAEESDRLKTVFLANISHEIRSPMNAIIGFSDLLKNQDLNSSKREHYLNIIKLKSNQLLHLINDIIDISRIETNNISITPGPNNLNFILDELHEIYQEVLTANNKNRSVKLTLHKSLLMDDSNIIIDGNRLKQILSNLLDNALKFTESGEIEFGYTMNGNNMIHFYVKDTGIGISFKKLKVIFDSFRQADDKIGSKYGGVGLGLSIVKNLVELSGGTIWVNSRPGFGSEFYFSLPFIPVEEDNREKIFEERF